MFTATAAGAGPAYDADMAVSLNGVDLYVAGTPSASTFQFAIPPMAATGAFPLIFSNIGANQFAQRTTFTVNSISLDDTYEAVNNDPTTSPLIAANGDYFVVLHGDCDEGVATGPSDDCDDFFTITNATGAPVSVRVRLDWHEASDVDLLWCDAPCGAFVGNFAGATGANPEVSTVSIPAATTWRLYLNLYDNGGDDFAFVKVNVTGLP
ncbi:MAG: hypothetical protein EXR93_03285 [Gemmatimonadetes bacterium]|nr:hypothetical protein [Gemmatimonadota bacterium]